MASRLGAQTVCKLSIVPCLSVALVASLHEVLAVDFHPRGTVLATASDDHSMRVWDLRKRRLGAAAAPPLHAFGQQVHAQPSAAQQAHLRGSVCVCACVSCVSVCGCVGG